jgi:hypothetical protein
MRLGPALALCLLLAACGSAREAPPEPAKGAGYPYNPAESWLLDHMNWVPSFMKPPRGGAE